MLLDDLLPVYAMMEQLMDSFACGLLLGLLCAIVYATVGWVVICGSTSGYTPAGHWRMLLVVATFYLETGIDKWETPLRHFESWSRDVACSFLPPFTSIDSRSMIDADGNRPLLKLCALSCSAATPIGWQKALPYYHLC